MAKASNAARTTISVPADLKRRMEKVRDVNWSAVATRAFEAELLAIAQRKKGLDMDSVRERLAASKEAGETESFQQGHALGVEWAKTEAAYHELKRLLALQGSLEYESPDFDWHFGEEVNWNVGQGGLPGWLGEEVFLDAEYDWEVVFGDDADQVLDDGEKLRGFCYGAIEVFEEAGI